MVFLESHELDKERGRGLLGFDLSKTSCISSRTLNSMKCAARGLFRSTTWLCNDTQCSYKEGNTCMHKAKCMVRGNALISIQVMGPIK